MNQAGIILGRIMAVSAGFILAFYAYTYGPIPGYHFSTQAPFIIKNKYPGLPARLLIPALSVDQEIEAVGQDENSRMAVPQNVFNAGWYQFGVRPGAIGNAVIDGHVNTPQLTPSIFANLKTLQAGDTVSVIDDRGQTWTFLVTHTKEYPDVSFPVRKIFGSSPKSQLNLVTCSGAWDKAKKTFTQRTVVFTELAT